MSVLTPVRVILSLLIQYGFHLFVAVYKFINRRILSQGCRDL